MRLDDRFLKIFIETSFNKVSRNFQIELDFHGKTGYIFPESGQMNAMRPHGHRILLISPRTSHSTERNTHEPFAARTIEHLYDRISRHPYTFCTCTPSIKTKERCGRNHE